MSKKYSFDAPDDLAAWLDTEGEKFPSTAEAIRFHLRNRAQVSVLDETADSHVEAAYEALNAVDPDAPTPVLVTAVDDAHEHLSEVVDE